MGKVVQFTKDSLRSFVGALGGIRFGQRHDATGGSVPLMTDVELLETYRSGWIGRKIVDIPALDSFRAWRAWQAEQDEIEAIEAEEKRLKVKAKFLEAKILARLFGGAAIYISTGETDLMKPLDPARVRKGGIRFLNVLRRRQLVAGDIDLDPESEYCGQPAWFTLNNGTATQLQIHPSRLIIFKGEAIPDPEIGMTLGVQRGWGDSVLVSRLTAIQDAESTAANIARLVFKARVAVIKVPDLMASLMDPEYKTRLLERYKLMNDAEGINATTLLDAEEEYVPHTTSFATLPDVLDRFLQIVSGAADIPATRLLGQAPAGMNSTGESDLRNYYDRISSGQEIEIDPAISLFDECLIMSALGTRPLEIFHEWNPLWQMTDKEIAEIGNIYADIATKLTNTGMYQPETLATAFQNAFVEKGVLPGFDAIVDETGGLPDYEAELEAETNREVAKATALAAAKTPANGNQPPRRAANDGLQTFGRGMTAYVVDSTPRTLFVRRDVLNRAELVAWAKSQGFNDVQEKLHVTIVSSKEALDWHKLGEEHGGDEDGILRIKPGGPRSVEQFGEAIVLEISSYSLYWRHIDAKHAGASYEYEEYRPHITISWQRPEGMDLRAIEPYRGEIVLGPEIFEEVKSGWQTES